DHEDLGKFDAKADIRIFVGYARAKKAFRIYNRRTRMIFETIHITFDELKTMASEQLSSGLGIHVMTTNTPTAAPRAEVLADFPVSISISQDAPSTSIPSSQEQEHSPIIFQENLIGDPSRSVSIRKQLETDAMWCYFDAFLSSVEPKNFKQAMTEPSRIDAMQEEIHEFERLEVWELVPCLHNVFLIKLKWIYKIKKDESGESRSPDAREYNLIVMSHLFSLKSRNLSTSLLEFDFHLVKILLYDHSTITKTFYLIFHMLNAVNRAHLNDSKFLQFVPHGTSDALHENFLRSQILEVGKK
nr:hypothetical protein [Tanacetum cinerariifolium]